MYLQVSESISEKWESGFLEHIYPSTKPKD